MGVASLSCFLNGKVTSIKGNPQGELNDATGPQQTMNSIEINFKLDTEVLYVTAFIEALGDTIQLIRKEQRNALTLVVLNLVYVRYAPLSVPRARKRLGTKRHNPFGIGARSLATVLDKLIAHGYITQVLGYKDLALNTGYNTVITAKSELVRSLIDHGIHKDLIDISSHAEYLYLRNEKEIQGNKATKDFTNSYRSNMMTAELVSYNSLLSDTDIRVLADNDDAEIDLNSRMAVRKFTDFGMHEPDGSELFAFGGRMFGEWASLSKAQRQRIVLDGDQCVECDYPASHVNVMYKDETGDWHSEGDPYYLEINSREIPRHIVKKLSSLMMFVSSKSSAARALQSAYIPRGQGIEDLEGNSHAEDYIRAVDGVGIPSIIDAYLDKHSVIAHLFLRDKMTGANIQYLESELVMDVVNKLTAQRIPCLTIYDSFIVPETHEGTLRALMASAEFPNRNG